METSISRTQGLPDFELENQPAFNVVIVYEDFAAGKHAKETYDFLVHHLGHDYEFNNQMWKFDVLGNSKMREMAVKDATLADLIVVSTHGVGELPPEVKSWIEQWMAQNSRAKGLAVLMDRPADEDGHSEASISSYLQGIARRAKLDFFAQPNDWPDCENDFSTQQISERAERASTSMADFIHHQTPTMIPPRASAARWGINE